MGGCRCDRAIWEGASVTGQYGKDTGVVEIYWGISHAHIPDMYLSQSMSTMSG